MTDIKAEAKNRWFGIFQALGIAVGEHGKHTACPICGGKDRYRFDDKDGSGSWICNQCGAGFGVDLVIKVLNCDFADAVKAIRKVIGSADISAPQPEAKITPAALNKIYSESRFYSLGDPVDLYLRNRGLTVKYDKLRYHPNCWEPETKSTMPAMLATYQLADSTAITMHRTFLTRHGNKANIENPKKLLPILKPMCGGAIRLFEPENNMIGVAEGIETALAVKQLTNIPCWSTVSSVLMEKFEPPEGIKFVMIMGDRDITFTGEKAAYTLANRLQIKGFTVEVHIPKQGDWLDELRGKK